MLDQSFSASNFNIIFLKENRKGAIKKKFLNTEYFEKHEEFKKVLSEKIELKKSNGGNPLSKEQLDDFAIRLDSINKEKEEIRNNIFFSYSEIINSEEIPFNFNINYDKQKEVYTIKRDGVHFFVMKQLQYNIHKTFKVKQADRNSIISQVFNLLNDGFPKVVVRTDISKFYESIPQENLFELINNNTLLSSQSRKLLKRIFYEFNQIKDVSIIDINKGIPRGLGISAYLSELYMRRIDEEIRSLPDLIYYTRYVDDIVAIFLPKTRSTKRNYPLEIKRIINSYSLEINDNLEGRKDKTHTIDLYSDKTKNKFFFENFQLVFLGYEFKLKHFPKNSKTDVKIHISEKKINKYQYRIKKSIETYNIDSKFNEKIARKMLFDRLRFLSGNFRLNNNKNRISSGIFYSNKMLELTGANLCMNRLNQILDDELEFIEFHLTNDQNDLKKLKNLIKTNFCFISGFYNKDENFYSFKFNSKENEIYRKKFGRLSNKYEVIKSIWKDE